MTTYTFLFFFFSSRRRHTRLQGDWSSDVCSSDLLELGRRQLAQGARGITVSTLFEAQAFAGGGFTDLTWAFPLDPTHLPHVRRIADGGATLRVVPGDLEAAEAVGGKGGGGGRGGGGG